jgi:hypothetical protein
MAFGLGIPCGACGCTENPCPPFDYTAIGYNEANNSTWLAQSFVVPAGGITLTSATLSIAGYDPLAGTLPPGSYANYPRSKLYANEDGTGVYAGNVRPAVSSLATLTAPAIGSLGNATWTFTHSGYSLTAGLRYWISLENNGYWNYYQSSITPPFVGLPDGYCEGPGISFTTTAGAVWVFATSYSETPFLLTVN